MAERYVMMLIRDGLQLASGFVSEQKPCLVYARVPEEWLDGPPPQEAEALWLAGPLLSEARLEHLFEAIYGAGWRAGNEDGSRYVVIKTAGRLLNAAEHDTKPWLGDDINDGQRVYLHYAVDPSGQLQRVSVLDL